MEKLINIAESCLSQVKEKGVDKAFVSVASNVKTEFNVDGGEFSLFRTLFDNRLSLTVYNKGKKGVISINKFDDESIAKAIDDCIISSLSAEPDDAWDIAEISENRSFTDGCPEADVDRLFERTEELLNDIKRLHPTIMVEQMIVDHTRIEKVYVNTNGVRYTTVEGEYNADVMFSAHEGDISSSFFSSGVITSNLDKPFITLSSIDRDLTDVANQVHTKAIEGKFVGTVLLPPQALSYVIGSALDLFCGDYNMLNATSIWKDKLGETVTDKRITVTSCPLDERIVCGERYTGEGYLSENYDIIKNGVLNSFMLSDYVAKKIGKERAKNSSSAILMQNGTTPLADIIKGIKRGIVVGRFSGGAPAANGEFSSVAKNSFYIENGEIKYSISETMVSGNLATLLNNLRDISIETVETGMSVMPYAAFDGVTISGK